MRPGQSFLLLLLVATLIAPLPARTKPRDYLLYVGTYTRNEARGIYAYRFEASSGRTVPIGLAAETVNPSFLAVHPNGRFIYAANEVSKNGFITAWSINPKTGQLKLLNQASSEGSDPCHISIDSKGKWLFAANYGSGTVSVLPVRDDGTLGKACAVMQHRGSSVNPKRQEGPHAHSVNLAPDNRFLLVSDLGLDRLMLYRFDAVKGALHPGDPPYEPLAQGSGPRHLSFHPAGRFVYQINELNSTITVFTYAQGSGRLQETQTISTVPQGFTGVNTTAEIQVHPRGRFVYGSNRGHNSIAVFAIKGRQGTLEPVEYASTQGRTPRQFSIDPTGEYLFAANQDSGDIIQFRIDSRTGKLLATGTVLKNPTPVCIVFVPVD
jgi:6-phosphogluconolactonase